jgi:hypothetical protein
LSEANGAHLFTLAGNHGGHFVLKGKSEPWQQKMNDEPGAN